MPDPTPVGPPLFTDEGPAYYAAAFAHNSPFSQGAPYKTTLTSPQETAFRAWVTAGPVPFDPDEDPTDYDMRGFYKASVIDNTIPDWTGPGSHFPDTYKTPYDTSFSNQSQYASVDCPFKWGVDPGHEDLLLDFRDGQVVFGPEGAYAGVLAGAFAVAFDADPMDVDAVWTRIDTLAGCRVRDWSVDRGRPDEFSKTGTGTAVIHIADLAGLFDPTNTTSPYYGKIVPGKQAAISLLNPVSGSWHVVFTGFVESWHYRLAPLRDWMDLELQLVDGFSILERAELIVGEDGVLPPFSGFADENKADLMELAKGNVLYGLTEGTGADRIHSVLGDVGWPTALRDVFSLNVKFGPKAYGPGTSALDAIWDAVDGEFPGVANAWMSMKTGVFTVHGRQARFRPDTAEYGIGHYTVGDPSAWSETADPDHNVVPVAELEWMMGEDNVYNACSATPQGIVMESGRWRMLDPAKDDVPGQYVKDDASISAYGLRSITFDQLQTVIGIHSGNNALEETKLFASYYVTNLSTPVPRVSRLVFKSRLPTDPHGPALWGFLCGVEISDLLNLRTLHGGGGGFSTATVDDFYVEGIHMTCRPGGPDLPIVELSLDVSPRAAYTSNPFPSGDGPF